MGWIHEEKTTFDRIRSAIGDRLQILARVRAAFRTRPTPTGSGQIAILAEATWKPVLKKNRDEIEKHAKAFREISSVNMTPEVETALKIIEEAAKSRIFDLPVLDPEARTPTCSEQSTVYTSFKPSKVIVQATAVAKFSGKNLPDADHAFEIPNAEDVMLTGLFSGSTNVFPNAPSDIAGIHCATFAANNFGIGISWPTVWAGIPVTAQFSILPTIYRRLVAPEGYDKIPRSVTVRINMHLYGFGED